MLIIAGHVTIDPTQRDTYIAAHHDLIRRARHAPGCLDGAITPDPNDPTRIYVYERWETRDQLTTWRDTCDAPHTGIPIDATHVREYTIAAERPVF
ncbi:putative quinol monooxygenase [Kibdelosporangium phytohabitans]|uniref:Antibiotic biosynthesis monooxygenase n=1 Tax=Kibdelosporangium phytohabitans TaxID=860235 RepID=A0A0N9I6S2_9PSEU|nr:antibiotic biosynthesis monooxygenase family protein [Kibdelosporangium phytohabitans]ALG10162.1 antibiotic biosynthesis monooxygenase [Kibdelosporangium phytohabitans]MBE1461165.1 quinol monooxygenase YgiN [Kibdelosporangium phytohabitans]